ncbi:MAG: hypothetical protein IK020_04595 [Clostridiales bacterium]|nr:hypothetical protein [Clostridiales bacterium]
MATLCRNCGNPLVYDPETRRIVCDACGSSFAAEQIEAYGKAFEEGNAPRPVDPVTGEPVSSSAVQEFFECNVYTCSSCGGEIFLSGTEASTTCIYCGSPSVIFSRISKEKRPDFILPFQVTKQQATEIIRQRFSNGMFVPNEFKNLQVDSIRGIYIPYWLIDVYHAESAIVSGETGSGDSSHRHYYARTGRMKMNNLLVEASMELNDSSSRLLEPYDLRMLRPFDEEYMLGFYSDASDITFGELRRIADQRASDLFKWEVFKRINISSCRLEKSQSATLIDKDLKYALLPVWFVTTLYEGKPHTILVNGQTGKLVCAVPWNKKKFKGMVALVGSIIGILAALLFTIIGLIFTSGFAFGGFGVATVLTSMIPLIAPVLVITGAFSLIGFIFYKNVTRQIELTQAEDTFNFTKKRQG